MADPPALLLRAMKFDPQSFFIGVIDFFSVLLPGALVAYLARDELGPILGLGAKFPQYGEAERWAVFLFASYLLGHFIFLVGAKLDDIYDAIRSATDWQQTKRRDVGKRPSSSLEKWLAHQCFGKDPDLAIQQALAFREVSIAKKDGKAPINAFQWAKARLTLQYPAALATVQRFEADSKFFRSFVVVLLLVTFWNCGKGHWPYALLGLVAMSFSFWRYVDQRYKATEQAYWYLITLQGSQTFEGKPQEVNEQAKEQKQKWETKAVSSQSDYLAPDSSEIRLLPSVKGCSVCQCTLPPQAVSRAVRHQSVEEIWYSLQGHGQLWRKHGNDEETVDLRPGTAATILPDTHFQFRNTGWEPLSILIATTPCWSGAHEAIRVPDHWLGSESKP
jgi:mannose-6-phosphate isomerase-like protein (cupin superfamily)